MQQQRLVAALKFTPALSGEPPDPAPPLSLQSSAELAAAPSLSVGGTLKRTTFVNEEAPQAGARKAGLGWRHGVGRLRRTVVALRVPSPE